jgi:hypothetical protein
MIPSGFKEVARVYLSDKDIEFLSVYRATAEIARLELDRACAIVAARYGGVIDHTRGSFVYGNEVILCEVDKDEADNQLQALGAKTGTNK